MSPQIFEALLFVKSNKRFWNAEHVSRALKMHLKFKGMQKITRKKIIRNHEKLFISRGRSTIAISIVSALPYCC